jgi:hypothetical protein
MYAGAHTIAESGAEKIFKRFCHDVEVGVSCALSVRRIIGTVMYAEAVIVDM